MVSELMVLRRVREAASRSAVPASPASLGSPTPSGSNPGGLKMRTFAPAGLPARAPLVVVLHGCTQNAADYDRGSGWSTLAARHGFALLYLEQAACNNANGCFNWFQPEDTARGHGEVASIAQMLKQTLSEHNLDPARVYITGFSAGGAMTAAMLATYPDLFAGGAIIAGLPFGAATSMASAFEAMRHLRSRPARAWGDVVRAASPFTGTRPAVQVWHGEADTTVAPQALDELAGQWADALGLQAPPTRDTVAGVAHATWKGPTGRVLLETYLVPGLGHGVPLDGTSDDLDDSVGVPGSYMLNAGISSTRRIASSWGLLTQAARKRDVRPSARQAEPFGGMIQGALRAAGLM